MLRRGFLLSRGKNLADLIDKAAARLNLGLGSAATQADTRYAHRANDLADLGNAATARGNLGLGNAATKNVGAGNGLDADTVDGLQGSQLLRNDVSGQTVPGRLLLQGHDIGAANVSYLEFVGSDGVRTGYVGDGAPGDANIYLSSSGGGVVIIEGGVSGRVYHAGHFPTGTGGVNTYALLYNTTATSFFQGDTTAGGNLRYSSADGTSYGYASGTWRCMGRAYSTDTSYTDADRTTVWVRIS